MIGGRGEDARLPPCGVCRVDDGREMSCGLRLSLSRFCFLLVLPSSDMAPPSLNEAGSVSDPAPGAKLFRFFKVLTGSGCEPLESLRMAPTGADDDGVGGTIAGDMGLEGGPMGWVEERCRFFSFL
jgi:hypothetical protein